MPLLKPSKSSTGKLNKVILDKINQQMQLITKVNQLNVSIILKTKNSYRFWYLKLKVFIPQLARICLLKPANFLNK